MHTSNWKRQKRNKHGLLRIIKMLNAAGNKTTLLKHNHSALCFAILFMFLLVLLTVPCPETCYAKMSWSHNSIMLKLIFFPYFSSQSQCKSSLHIIFTPILLWVCIRLTVVYTVCEYLLKYQLKYAVFCRLRRRSLGFRLREPAQMSKIVFLLTFTKTWQAFLQGTSVLHVIQY